MPILLVGCGGSGESTGGQTTGATYAPIEVVPTETTEVAPVDRAPSASVAELSAAGMVATAKVRVLDYRGDLDRVELTWSTLLLGEVETLDVADLTQLDDDAAHRVYEVVREFDYSVLPLGEAAAEVEQYGVEPRAYDASGATSPSNIYPVFLPQEAECNALAPGVKEPAGLPGCSDPYDEPADPSTASGSDGP